MTTRSRCLTCLLFAALLLLVPQLAVAGANAGGTLILHANPSLVYTNDMQNPCGQAGLDSCSAAVMSVAWDPGHTIVFYAIAAFPPGSQPRLKGVSFGVDYDPEKFHLVAYHACADFDIPDGGWPAPGIGVGLSWNDTQTDLLREVYWFAGYTYSEANPDSTSFSLIPRSADGGIFVDDAAPRMADSVAAYGRLGFGEPGGSPCPAPLVGGDRPEVPGGGGPSLPPASVHRGPVWAYGVEVPGDAWFEERNGVVYYQGVHQFWPRQAPPPRKVPKAPARHVAAFEILQEAKAAAEQATTSSEWAKLFTEVLDAHRGDIVSYKMHANSIAIKFADVRYGVSVTRPTAFPWPEARAVNPDSIGKARVDKFWRFYNNGSWIMWGVDYFMVEPPTGHSRTIAAIDAVKAFEDRGLTGAALIQAITTIDIKDTALQERSFLRDIIARREER